LIGEHSGLLRDLMGTMVQVPIHRNGILKMLNTTVSVPDPFSLQPTEKAKPFMRRGVHYWDVFMFELPPGTWFPYITIVVIGSSDNSVCIVSTLEKIGL